MTLANAPYNKPLLLENTSSKELSLRLMEMGCLSGMHIEKLRTAPAKGLILIKMQSNGNLLALRYEEAQLISILCKEA